MKHHFKIVKEEKLEYTPQNFLDGVRARGVFFKCVKCGRELILNDFGLTKLYSGEILMMNIESCTERRYEFGSFTAWLRARGTDA